MKSSIKLTILSVAFVFLCSYSTYSQQFNALLITKTAGWQHESIHDGVAALSVLAARHNFKVDWFQSARRLNDQMLEQYQVIIMLNTTQDIFNDEEQAAFKKFIQSGKGFVGVHAAADTEYDWPWYRKLVGHMFKIHPAQQTAKLRIVDNNFPGMEGMPQAFWWTDEWYTYQDAEVNDLNILLRVDENTYDAKVSNARVTSEGMGEMHPIAWYHNFDGGRAFYTGLGHISSIYKDKLFLDHLYGGIFWAATGRGIE